MTNACKAYGLLIVWRCVLDKKPPASNQNACKMSMKLVVISAKMCDWSFYGRETSLFQHTNDDRTNIDAWSMTTWCNVISSLIELIIFLLVHGFFTDFDKYDEFW